MRGECGEFPTFFSRPISAYLIVVYRDFRYLQLFAVLLFLNFLKMLHKHFKYYFFVCTCVCQFFCLLSHFLLLFSLLFSLHVGWECLGVCVCGWLCAGVFYFYVKYCFNALTRYFIKCSVYTFPQYSALDINYYEATTI